MGRWPGRRARGIGLWPGSAAPGTVTGPSCHWAVARAGPPNLATPARGPTRMPLARRRLPPGISQCERPKVASPGVNAGQSRRRCGRRYQRPRPSLIRTSSLPLASQWHYGKGGSASAVEWGWESRRSGPHRWSVVGRMSKSYGACGSVRLAVLTEVLSEHNQPRLLSMRVDTHTYWSELWSKFQINPGA